MKKYLPLVALVAVSASADDTYFGFAYTQAANNAVCAQMDELAETVFTGEVDENSCVDRADGKKLTLGYRPFRWVGIELSYFGSTQFHGHVGRYTTTLHVRDSIKSRIDGAELAIVGFLPLPGDFTLTANAGVFSWDAEYEFSHSRSADSPDFDPSASAEDSENDATPKYGVGFVLIGTENVALVGSFDRYTEMPTKLGFEEELDVVSIGFQVQF